MKEKHMILVAVSLIVGILIGVVFTTNSINSKNTGMMRMMGINQITDGRGMMGSMDAHFIEQMIPHHEDAITMANLAQTKATHPEIKTLADAIISGQSREIKQMQEWYKSWYGKDVPEGTQVMGGHGMMHGGTMHMGMMGNETDTARLQEAEDFDKTFIEEMIPHHQMAVMMAQMLLRGTNRPEMQKLGQDIIDAQTKEINDMRSWYSAWGY